MNGKMSKMALRLHEKLTGRRILERLEELNRTQWLSGDELLALQQSKLQRVVAYAYHHVPYYRRTFQLAGFEPEDLRRDPASFAKLPTLTKEIIRENWQDMMTTEPKRRQSLTQQATSGSTGHPLVFMEDGDFRDYSTADIQRHLGWAGWDFGTLHAYMWGLPMKQPITQSLRTRLINLTWNRFITDAFVTTEASMAAFAKELLRRRPRILMSYATSIHRFAQFVTSSNLDIPLDAVFTSAEILLPQVRTLIEKTFQCRVFNRYGTLELGGIGCECQGHTGLHLSMESNYLEIIRDERYAGTGETGDVVVTNLNNLGMPFIRYMIGDAGAWHSGGKCPCGRASQMLNPPEGRKMELFKTRDGRIVLAAFGGAPFRCLANPCIKQFQVVQKSLDDMLVRLVPETQISQQVLDSITESVKQTFGDNVTVQFELSREIAPLPSGKHSYAVSELG
jgi:phenylacetate-CoA ligase